MEQPTLHTERLVLLPLGPADLDEVSVLYSDAEVMRFVAGGVKDRATTAAILQAASECWRRHGFGLWAIRDPATGALLGEGGLQSAASPYIGGGDLTTDFGLTFARRNWGRGLATEAGEAMLRDAWSRYDGPCIHGLVSADNTASQRVLSKLGFVMQSALVHDDRPHQLWVVSRPEAATG